MRKILLILGIAMLLFSCKKNKIITPIQEKINFNYPKVGQISKYVLLKGYDYFSDNSYNYEYLNDTILLEVVKVEKSRLKINEYLSEGSESLNGISNVSYPQETWEYFLSLENGELNIEKINDRYDSRVFFLYDSYSLPLGYFLNPEVDILGWKTNVPYQKSNIKAFAKYYNQFGEIYENLNINIQNNPMVNGHPGQTHIYSAKDGLVRSSQYSAQNGIGFGWDLLP